MMLNEDLSRDLQSAQVEAAKALASARPANKRIAERHMDMSSRMASVASPAKYWARVAALDTDENMTSEEAEAVIKLTASQLTVGNLEFVTQTCVGQIGWLSVMAVEFKYQGDRETSPNVQEKLYNRALRCQNAAAKLTLSLAALVQMGNGGGRGEREVKGS